MRALLTTQKGTSRSDCAVDRLWTGVGHETNAVALTSCSAGLTAAADYSTAVIHKLSWEPAATSPSVHAPATDWLVYATRSVAHVATTARFWYPSRLSAPLPNKGAPGAAMLRYLQLLAGAGRHLTTAAGKARPHQPTALLMLMLVWACCCLHK
jgi:hypothetical protein